MKTATLPPLRVAPELRQAAEFIARGLAAREEARRTGVYHDAGTVHAELRGMLETAKAKAKAKAKA